MVDEVLQAAQTTDWVKDVSPIPSLVPCESRNFLPRSEMLSGSSGLDDQRVDEADGALISEIDRLLESRFDHLWTNIDANFRELHGRLESKRPRSPPNRSSTVGHCLSDSLQRQDSPISSSCPPPTSKGRNSASLDFGHERSLQSLQGREDLHGRLLERRPSTASSDAGYPEAHPDAVEGEGALLSNRQSAASDFEIRSTLRRSISVPANLAEDNFAALQREKRTLAYEKAKAKNNWREEINESGTQDLEIVSESLCWVWFRSKLRTVVYATHFDVTFGVLIISNAAFIGYQVEHKVQSPHGDEPFLFFFIQLMYMVVFGVELLMRFLVEGFRFWRSPEWAWNLFDTLVMSFSIFEALAHFFVGDEGKDSYKNISILRMLRIVRVVRVMRVIRLIRFFKALRVLVFAIFHTLKSCVWALLLLTMILYVFAVIFTQAAADEMEKGGTAQDALDLYHYYGGLGQSIFTLFKSMSGGVSWQEVVKPLAHAGASYVALFVAFFSFVYFAVMNVVTGLFCQSAIESAQRDQDDVIAEQLKQKEKYIHVCKKLFQDIDTDQYGAITIVDFEANLDDRRVQGFFESMEIEPSDAWVLFNLLDTDGQGSVDVEEFVVGCLRLRGTAKGLHIAQMMHENRWMMDKLAQMKAFIEEESRITSEREQVYEQLLTRAVNLMSRTLHDASTHKDRASQRVSKLNGSRESISTVQKPVLWESL